MHSYISCSFNVFIKLIIDQIDAIWDLYAEIAWVYLRPIINSYKYVIVSSQLNETKKNLRRKIVTIGQVLGSTSDLLLYYND